MSIDWSLLAKDGYIILRNFFPTSELTAGFIDEISQLDPDESGVIRSLPDSINQILSPYAEKLFLDIKSNSTLKVNSKNSYCAIKVTANPNDIKSIHQLTTVIKMYNIILMVPLIGI